MKTPFLFAFLAGVAFAGTRDPGVPDSRHVAYGERFACVGLLECREAGTGRAMAASAVAIDPHWVLTAAHVVDDAEQWSVVLTGTTHKIVEVVVHDGFAEGKIGCCDIAVGRVAEDLGLEFYPALYDRDDEEGKVVSIAGYGLTGTFDSGHVTSDDKRRAGSNVVDYVASQGLLVCSVGSGVQTELEFLLSPGDSGGGLFIGNSLAGVNSVVMAKGRSPSSKRGEESGHVRISTHKEWICEAIGRK
jgi:S1-C subfamily serine protease